jgi:hypothetical protein
MLAVGYVPAHVHIFTNLSPTLAKARGTKITSKVISPEDGNFQGFGKRWKASIDAS